MPETPLSEWDKDKTGALVARALVGWGTVGATDGNSGVLRLEYATDPTLKERAAIQLFISTPRVRELAEGLTRLAEYLESALAADKSQGPAN